MRDKSWLTKLERNVWETRGGDKVLILRTSKNELEKRMFMGVFIDHKILVGPYYWASDGTFLLSHEKASLHLIIPEYAQ